MKKVLFMPLGIGLAHIGRLVEIAHQLKRYSVDISFASGTDAVDFIKREGFKFYKIAEFTRVDYDQKIKKNNWFIYNRKNVRDFVLAELKLLRKIKPDLVVYDTRLTARASSSILSIPTVSVNNVDITPYYDFSKIKFPIQTTLGKFIPQRVVNAMDKKYSHKALMTMAKNFMSGFFLSETFRLGSNLIDLGFKLSIDPFQLIVGDMMLLSDIPEFRPMKELPSKVKLVGPVFWDGIKKLPEWAGSISCENKIIYVTASGTGDRDLFIKILKFLIKSKYTIVATTGNTLKPKDVPFSAKNLYITDYLPGKYIMPKASLIVFPGGNATCYQALTYGVPQICTPFHIDQEDNANQLVRLKTGVIINPHKDFSASYFLKKIEETMGNPEYKNNSLAMMEILKNYNGKRTAAKYIYEFLKSIS